MLEIQHTLLLKSMGIIKRKDIVLRQDGVFMFSELFFIFKDHQGHLKN